MQVFPINSLRSRLTRQYGGLFAAVILSLSAALYMLTGQIATSNAERQLTSISDVYDRLWTERAQQLQLAAGLLSKDFGLRAAIATGDRSTAASALDNLKRRLGIGTAFIVDMNGKALIGDPLPAPAEAEKLWYAFDSGKLVGVAQIGGKPHHVVAAPIMAPELLGWIVFAVDLDQRQMNSLEQLSPVPITAGVAARSGQSRWQRISGRFAELDGRDSNAISQQSRSGSGSLLVWHDDAFAVVRTLPSLADSDQAALLLVYPKAQALSAYSPIRWAILVFALLGMFLVYVSSWRSAEMITRPLARLDEAARRLADGQRSYVPVEGEDELARLSAQFNRMVDQIEDRERRITHLAFNDVLTGLPNRAMFLEHAPHLLGDEQTREFALMCLDLDNFTNVNDTLGHHAGDQLLKKVADRLSDMSFVTFIARLGGDEFVVLADTAGGIATAERCASRILAEVSRTMVIEGQEVVPGTSIGIALAGKNGDDVDTLLRNADLALYRAKEAGRSTYCFFEESFNERAQTRRQIEADLRGAIERGEFELQFQPLFDLATGRITTFEALIRWNHPTLGRIAPNDFIPVAEDFGLIVEIGAWAMREACNNAIGWPGDIRVAVNVSSIQFHRPGLSEVVLQALAKSGLPAHRLEIEITESIFLVSSEATLEVLHGLRSLGARIALDDFGTGYSSLSYLQSFPFDKIKIDRSFIQALTDRPGAAAIIKAITDLAGALGMETTAEGVEDSEQLAQLKAQGCTSAQGFLFSRPIPASEVPAIIAEQETGPESKRDVA